MEKVLILSCDDKAGTKLQESIKKLPYKTYLVREHETILAMLCKVNPEIVIIDLANVPNLSAIYKDIEDSRLEITGIIVLITKENIRDVELLLKPDDFLIKPFSIDELEARIRKILWEKNKIDVDDAIKVGSLIIDLKKYEVRIGPRKIDLTYQEFRLLKYLASHPGIVHSRESLLDNVWGYDYYGGTRTVDVHIRRLRAKLGTHGRDLIQTHHRLGYTLEA